jgi:translation initiation factor IF-2
MDDAGQLIPEAYPGDIVEIAGISDYPNSTEKMIGMSNEANARQYVSLSTAIHTKFFKEQAEMIHSDFKIKFDNRREKRKFIGNANYQKEKMANALGDVNIQIKKELERKHREQEENGEELTDDVSIELQNQALGLTHMLEEMENKAIKNPVLIKVSNMGVKDTIQQWINRLENKNFTLCGISCGQVTEHDIVTTKQVKGKIVLFDLPSDDEIKNLLKEAGIGLISHNIIYKLFEDLENWKSGADDPFNSKITIKGKGKVKKVFKFADDKGKQTQVAGCIVDEGAFNKSHVYRIVRNGKLVASNLKILSLKRFKEEVSHVKSGQDAGISFVNHTHFEEDDIIESH